MAFNHSSGLVKKRSDIERFDNGRGSISQDSEVWLVNALAEAPAQVIGVSMTPLYGGNANAIRLAATGTAATSSAGAAANLPDEDAQDFLANATVALHTVGPDGTILWANVAELEFLGYERDEYVGRSIKEFHADAANITDILARLTRNEELRDHEACLRAKDGTIKYVLINSNVHRKNGEFVHTRCFTRDITRQKLVENARQADLLRTQRLSRVTAAIADAVTAEEVFEAVVDRVGAVVDASRSALWLDRGGRACLVRSSNYPDEAQHFDDLLDLRSAGSFPAVDTIRENRAQWFASKEDLVSVYPQVGNALPHDRSLRIACLPVVSRGRAIGALGFSFDQPAAFDDEEKAFLLVVARFAGQALERVRLLEAEKESAARAELLYRLAAAVNSAITVEKVFEVALDVIGPALGTTTSAILVFDARGVMGFKAWRGLSAEYRRAADGHSPWSPETRDPQPIVSRDVEQDPGMASYLPALRSEGIGALAFIPLFAGGKLIGKLTAYYGGPRDFARQEIDLANAIGDYVAAAISRFEAASELEQTVRFNEMFTGILAHDLRNPLSAVIMAARLAITWNENPRLIKPLSRIVTSGDRMTRMIEQLLDFTRIRLQGGIPVSPVTTDLLPLVRQAMDELDDTNPEWNLRLGKVGTAEGLWDADRLSQVFSNLIANAIQHGDPLRGVEVSVDGSASDAVTITVHNSGTIPAKLLPRVFDAMIAGVRRLDSSRGLGLGLYITSEIIKAHGGHISVSSSADAGTTFIVSLPRSNR